MHRLARLAVLSLLFVPGPSLAAGDDAGSARGRLAWIFSDDLDLAGGLSIHKPWATGTRHALFLDVDTTAAIRGASSLTFEVRDLEYSANLGLAARSGQGYVVSGSVEQWGTEATDAEGSAWVRSAVVGFESAAYRARPLERGLEGRAGVGLVIDERGVDATAVFHGELRYSFPGERLGFGFDVRADALAGEDGEVDLEAGPRLDVLRTPGSSASFFLRYLRAKTPLGLRTSGLVLGFEDAGGPGGPGASPPEVEGAVAAGGGGERGAGRLALRFLSPSFFRDRVWAAGRFDLNLLTSSDVSDLYYVYDVGLETARGGAIEGLYFRHRSNHRLADAGAPITSVDLIEAGIETPAWSRPDLLASGTWDAVARVGVLLDTSFGEQGGLHALAGARFVLPRKDGARILPYARVEVEDGEVGRRSYALGFFGPQHLDVALQYLSDAQLYARDRTALLLSVGTWF